jgi:predicted nucleic acid-binding protein
MWVYLDNCCLNRPYDEQEQDKVILEGEAVLSIIDRCETDDSWGFFSSDVLDDEIDRIRHPIKKLQVLNLYKAATKHIALNNQIVTRAKSIEQCAIKPFDALHLANAEYAQADILLTTDNKFIKHAKEFNSSVRVENPLIWLMEVINEHEHETD